MSILDELISAARQKQQDEQRKELDKQAKKVRRIIGKDLYATLDIQPNEYRGLLEFEVRGVTFYLVGPAVGWGVTVTSKHDYDRPYGASTFATDASDLLLFIEKHTR